MRRFATVPEENNRHWSQAFVGRSVDERGIAAIAFATKHSDRVSELAFDVETNNLLVDGVAVLEGEIPESLLTRDVLLEATTLGFVELYRVAKERKDADILDLSIIYAEPADYRSPERQRPLTRRDFELTDEVQNFAAVPGATLLLRNDDAAHGAFLVGYEGQRLEQLLDQTNISSARCHVIFGVPAFQPGWEMNSFANNLPVLLDHSIRSLLYAGAQNPVAAYRALEEVWKTTSGSRLLIGPIGTKPHGIGAALFACEHNGVGLVYDHPVRKGGRTSDIASWHLYDVLFSS
jgi:hypothetical protein